MKSLSDYVRRKNGDSRRICTVKFISNLPQTHTHTVAEVIVTFSAEMIWHETKETNEKRYLNEIDIWMGRHTHMTKWKQKLLQSKQLILRTCPKPILHISREKKRIGSIPFWLSFLFFPYVPIFLPPTNATLGRPFVRCVQLNTHRSLECESFLRFIFIYWFLFQSSHFRTTIASFRLNCVS